jgi:hypothetical protein
VELVREHLAAGADHVALIPPGADIAASPEQLESIAPELACIA